MIKNVRIVSLSAGTIGEDFVKHELDIGVKRLKDMGLNVSFSANALKGIDYIKAHPEKRAEDLLEAFRDSSVDMILCAIGGDDTYRLLPYLFGNNELKKAVSKKVFLGFSDSTMNHLMLHKVGLNTFYGQSFLADVCDIAPDMLPYSKSYFTELITTGKISTVRPSNCWYEGRTDYSEAAVGTITKIHENKGFELLQGSARFSGKVLGGCIDTLYDIFDNSRYADSVELCEQYRLFPASADWKGKLLLLESSEEQMPPEKFWDALGRLKAAGVFKAVNGLLVGKPMDEVFYDEYKSILVEVVDDPLLPILYNVNIGHALPRCIIPFGVTAHVDAEAQTIDFDREETQ